MWLKKVINFTLALTAIKNTFIIRNLEKLPIHQHTKFIFQCCTFVYYLQLGAESCQQSIIIVLVLPFAKMTKLIFSTVQFYIPRGVVNTMSDSFLKMLFTVGVRMGSIDGAHRCIFGFCSKKYVYCKRENWFLVTFVAVQIVSQK